MPTSEVPQGPATAAGAALLLLLGVGVCTGGGAAVEVAGALAVVAGVLVDDERATLLTRWVDVDVVLDAEEREVPPAGLLLAVEGPPPQAGTARRRTVTATRGAARIAPLYGFGRGHDSAARAA